MTDEICDSKYGGRDNCPYDVDCPDCEHWVQATVAPVRVDCMVSRQDTFGGAKVLDDGCGNTWVNQCESCKKIGTLEIVRPGKVQCSNCG